MDAPDQGQSAAGASIRRSILDCLRKKAISVTACLYSKNRANHPKIAENSPEFSTRRR